MSNTVPADALSANAGVAAIAAAIAGGTVSATQVLDATLARIARHDPAINSFTAVLADRARASAMAVDRARAAGQTLPPLAGVPYAVKNLFDVAGVTTLAGSKILADQPPAKRDATLVERLDAQGAVLVGALNMDEFAYGFTTENSHAGPTRNPHDATRSAGGSSGGSAAAVAAGLVPLTLGSDTNGSIRVPSSLCGIFGLKPTYGRMSRARSYPFVTSFDHLGPFARNCADLALAYDAMAGADADDPACARHPVMPLLPVLGQGCGGLRIAVAGGYFNHNASPATLQALAAAASALGVTRTIELPEIDRARAAAFVIANCEGAQIHLDHLRHRFDDMEPLSRDRFMAGALLPAAWYLSAQRFRRWFHDRMLAVFSQVDVILTAATPRSALPLGQETFELNGRTVLTRPSMGLLTQPISFIGLPVAVAPLPGQGDDGLPVGVQIIGAPWREDHCIRVAAALQASGIAQAPVAAGFA